MEKRFRIGTRTSPLAIEQVEEFINLLYRNFKNSDTMIRGYGGNNLISPDWGDRERKRTPRGALAPMEVSCALEHD